MGHDKKWHDRLLRPLMSKRQRQRMGAKAIAWLDRPFFKDAYAKHGSVTGIPDQRVFFLQAALLSLKDIEGDVAECGVRHGRSTLFMAHAAGGKRQFHIFDSFEGLSDPVPDKDPGVESFKKDGETRKFHIRNLDRVLGRFNDYPEINVYQGWIPDRFPEVEDRRFALIHVDVDMYQPTLDTLDFFWDRLTPGGIVICDDYGAVAYPGAEKAMEEFFADKFESPVELPTGQAIVIKSR